MTRTDAIKFLKTLYTNWLDKLPREDLTTILADDYEGYLNDKDDESLEIISHINYEQKITIKE